MLSGAKNIVLAREKIARLLTFWSKSFGKSQMTRMTSPVVLETRAAVHTQENYPETIEEADEGQAKKEKACAAPVSVVQRAEQWEISQQEQQDNKQPCKQKRLSPNHEARRIAKDREELSPETSSSDLWIVVRGTPSVKLGKVRLFL